MSDIKNKCYTPAVGRIAILVAEFRKREGISQQELANRLGASVNFVFGLEKGTETNITRVYQLATVFGPDFVDALAESMLELVAERQRQRRDDLLHEASKIEKSIRYTRTKK